MSTVAPLRCLRLAEVLARVGLAETCLRGMVLKGQFPAPFKLGVRAVGWLEADVDSWITERAARREATRFKI